MRSQIAQVTSNPVLMLTQHSPKPAVSIRIDATCAREVFAEQSVLLEHSYPLRRAAPFGTAVAKG
jgi:hypothetical protein